MLIESKSKFSLSKFLFWFCSVLLFLFFVGLRIWGYGQIAMSKTRIGFEEGRPMAYCLEDSGGNFAAAMTLANSRGTDLGVWSAGGTCTNSRREALAVRTVAVAGEHLVVWEDFSFEWVVWSGDTETKKGQTKKGETKKGETKKGKTGATQPRTETGTVSNGINKS